MLEKLTLGLQREHFEPANKGRVEYFVAKLPCASGDAWISIFYSEGYVKGNDSFPGSGPILMALRSGRLSYPVANIDFSKCRPIKAFKAPDYDPIFFASVAAEWAKEFDAEQPPCEVSL